MPDFSEFNDFGPFLLNENIIAPSLVLFLSIRTYVRTYVLNSLKLFNGTVLLQKKDEDNLPESSGILSCLRLWRIDGK